MCHFDRSRSRSEGRSGEIRSCFSNPTIGIIGCSAITAPRYAILFSPLPTSVRPTRLRLLDHQTQILPATLADAEALSVLSALVFPLGCPANTPPEDLASYINREHTPDRYRAMLNDDRYQILIAKVAGSLAALALLVQVFAPPEMQATSALELRRFYVDPAYHGRGVANQLMKEVLAAAAERGQSSLWLSAFSGNGRAIAFYKRWGFRITGEHDFMVGNDRQRDYLMLRQDPDGSSRTL